MAFPRVQPKSTNTHSNRPTCSLAHAKKDERETTGERGLFVLFILREGAEVALTRWTNRSAYQHDHHRPAVPPQVDNFWLSHLRRSLDDLLGQHLRARTAGRVGQKGYGRQGGQPKSNAHSQHTRTKYATVTRARPLPSRPKPTTRSARIGQHATSNHQQGGQHTYTRYRTITAVKHAYRPTSHRSSSYHRPTSTRRYKPPVRTYTRYHTVTLHHPTRHTHKPVLHRTATRTVTQRHTVTKHPSPVKHRPLRPHSAPQRSPTTRYVIVPAKSNTAVARPPIAPVRPSSTSSMNSAPVAKSPVLPGVSGTADTGSESGPGTQSGTAARAEEAGAVPVPAQALTATRLVSASSGKSVDQGLPVQPN